MGYAARTSCSDRRLAFVVDWSKVGGTVDGVRGRAETRSLAPFEIRSAAGSSSTVQCVFNGGPYTVASHSRHVQAVCPPP
jgi:hypothetical protein